MEAHRLVEITLLDKAKNPVAKFKTYMELIENSSIVKTKNKLYMYTPMDSGFNFIEVDPFEIYL